jgi:hypothetical protein
MVSNMSSTSRRTSSSTAPTSALRCRSGSGLAPDPHDPPALDHDRRGAALDGDPRLLHPRLDLHLLDVAHLADDAAAGHDLVVLLEVAQQLGVLLPRLAGGTEDQEVEDEADRRHLEQEDGEAAAGLGLEHGMPW